MEKKVTSFVDHFVDASDGKQKRSWEDDFLDPIDSLGQGFVTAIGNGNVLYGE